MKVLPAFPMKGCGLRGAKKARHAKKGRGENGRTKAPSCQAKWLHRYACKKPRACRDPMYASIMRSIDRKSGDATRFVAIETHGLGKRANTLQIRQRIAA